MLNAASEAFEAGATAILIPIYCAAEVICDVLSWFGVDCSTSKSCFKQARQDAGDANILDDAAGLIPGVADVTDETMDGLGLTGAWHHISTSSGNTNEYDDRQGLFLQQADPFPSSLDIAVTAVGELLGLSLNYNRSNGPKNYEILHGTDFHQNTDHRSKGEWQFHSFGLTPMEPLDNLAEFGWAHWKASGNTAFIGYPLHAIADATNPHHIFATIGHGHRPFEDATEQRWLWVRDVLRSDEEQTPTSLQKDVVLGSANS